MNTKKILGIFICMLVMTMIPVAAGTNIETPQPSKLGTTFVQGIITQPKIENNGALMSFRCIFVHYNTIGVTQGQTGFLWGWQRLVLPGDFHGIIGNHFIAARFPGYMPI
jgi:hypothetical protein